MNSDSDLQSSAAMIHQSLEEVHTLLSALEAQTKLGLFPAQIETESVEIAVPAEQSLVLEDDSFLTDWF
ncbi:MAG: hypothetical protein JO235_25055 [Chroococcidiopsidaceae cyanobacterium CP_BM_RX_35]|nr:hypothetical protein [Chroococcidiopsidaceae cyanobacterium CP_BM_RX_35]